MKHIVNGGLRTFLFTKKYYAVLFLGAMSIGLYTLLYFFNADLTQIAQQTHEGNKGLFFVPILIALLFSAIHGTFTSRFWDAMGIKPKK